MRSGRGIDVLAAMALCLAAGGAVAQSDAPWDCKDRSVLGQQGINWCLGQDFEAADAELNAVYQDAMARVPDGMATLLRAAQRAWIPFRDAACEAEAEFMRGGSGEPMMRLGCLVRETRARTEVLRMFAEVG